MGTTATTLPVTLSNTVTVFALPLVTSPISPGGEFSREFPPSKEGANRIPARQRFPVAELQRYDLRLFPGDREGEWTSSVSHRRSEARHPLPPPCRVAPFTRNRESLVLPRREIPGSEESVPLQVLSADLRDVEGQGHRAPVSPHGGHPFQAERQPVGLLGQGLEVHEYLPFLLQAGLHQGGPGLAGEETAGRRRESAARRVTMIPRRIASLTASRSDLRHHESFPDAGYRKQLPAHDPIARSGGNFSIKKGAGCSPAPLFHCPFAGIRKIPAICPRSVLRVALVAEHALVGRELR